MGFEAVKLSSSLSSSTRSILSSATTRPFSLLAQRSLRSSPLKTHLAFCPIRPPPPPPRAASAAAPCGGFGSPGHSRRSFRGGVVAMAAPRSVRKSEEEWQAVLSPEQFHILRQKGTELFFEEGLYNCAGCGTPLYCSTTKFYSGCGWPAFYEGLPGAITCTADPDGMRTEITCAACGGHLGHVFKGEGFPTPTDERHCVNSISLKFLSANSYPS
ncbi:hypothetical protein ACJRO7_027176 [Eucalyptus globulus]|uniref:MsrB domain-containing protein n=1 Tax=Eucalyptus globulus TaxID=34317 RepID=A0ABD3JXJ2_EUCGL